MKAVVVRDGCVLLGRNDRGEWELPGGRMELGETTRQTLVRELQEETGLEVTVGPLLLAEPFEVAPGKTVFIVAYAADAADQPLLRSEEHRELAYVPLSSLPSTDLPDLYWQAITAAREWMDR